MSDKFYFSYDHINGYDFNMGGSDRIDDEFVIVNHKELDNFVPDFCALDLDDEEEGFIWIHKAF